MRKLFREWNATLIEAFRLLLTISVIGAFFAVGITLYNSSLTQDDFEEFKTEFEEDIGGHFDDLQDHVDGRFDALETLITNPTPE